MIVNADFVRVWNSSAVRAIRRGDVTSWDELMEMLGAETEGERKAAEKSIRMLREKLETDQIKKSPGDLMAVLAFLDL